MATPSFNLSMINLFIGLIHGHRSLYPISKEIKKLRYDIFAVEATIASSKGDVTPEAIASSQKMEHTLLTEWSHNALEAKQNQLEKYVAVSQKNLTDAGVLVDASPKNSLWLVVEPSYKEDFATRIHYHLHRVMLSCAAKPGPDGLCINYVVGQFEDKQLTQLLKQDINARRVPMGYVRVSLDYMSKQELAENVIQQIVAFLVKGKREFSTTDLCESIFQIWRKLDNKKKTTVKGRINHTMRVLTKKDFLAKFIRRKSPDDQIWEFVIPERMNISSFAQRIKNNLQRFMSEEYKGSYEYQLEMFIGEQSSLQPEPFQEDEETG